MRNIIRTISLVVLLIVPAQSCCAWEWKSLHEEADKIEVRLAEEKARKKTGSGQDMYVLGLVYLNLHKDTDADRIFNELLSLSPGLPGPRWGRAEVLRRRHNLTASENALKDVIRLNPEFYPAYISLAYINYTKLRFNESVKIARQVLKLGPEKLDLSNYVRAILLVSGSKGMIAHYGGPISKIINGAPIFSELKKAERLKPLDPAVLFSLGSFYLFAPKIAGGDKTRAEAYLTKAIKADPQYSNAYVRLAQLYKFRGDTQKYGYYLDKALQVDPGNELALDVKEDRCKFICLGPKEN